MNQPAHLRSRRFGGGLRWRAMTLIELIVVMGLLAVLSAISAPVLSRFFRGRALEEEARRMVALTRYARSEAVSRSVPMELWINSQTCLYGLRVQAGYDTNEAYQPLEYELRDDMTFELDAKAVDRQGDALIVFRPDGSIGEDGPATIRIHNTIENETIEIAKTDPLVGYVIGDESRTRWVASEKR